MCLIVIPQRPIQQLCAAAQQLQSMMDDGTIPAACNGGKPEQLDAAVAAFDRLTEATARVIAEQKQVSPFLRYRQEILGNYDTASRLRDMVMNLWNGRQANLSLLFHNADERHTRIALECIASFTGHGENDHHFMALADEINELDAIKEAV